MKIILPLYRIKERASAPNIFHCVKEIKEKNAKRKLKFLMEVKKGFFSNFFFYRLFLLEEKIL